MVRVRDIFRSVYGRDYPYPGFYDTERMRKLVYRDAVLFNVASCTARGQARFHPPGWHRERDQR